MFLELMQHTITKCATEPKLWAQDLYNGPQVIILDGPVGIRLVAIANAASRILQYNHPGLVTTVINSLNSVSQDFVVSKVLENCKKDMVTIVAGADVNGLQKQLRNSGFYGKVQTVFTYEDLAKYCNAKGTILDKQITENATEDAIHYYLKYFKVTKTLRYSTLFAYTVDALAEMEQEFAFSKLSEGKKYNLGIAKLLRILDSAKNSRFCKKLFFSTKLSYNCCVNVDDKTDDSVANEIVVRLSMPGTYTALEIFQGLKGSNI